MTKKKISDKKIDQPKVTPKVEPQKVEKGPTLKERISEVVDKYEGKDELKKAIFDLVQRVQFPEQFCPECDDRLFLNGQTYECLNCGYTRQFTSQAPVVTRTPITSIPRTPGKVPDIVEKTIQQAEENMADVPRRTAPSTRGAQIQKLVEQMGDSSVPPTKQDEEILKGADPNVRDVNWV